MTRSRVSICIVCYNSKSDITKCLDSLYKVIDLSKIQLQIFISDNNSSDGSVKFLSKRYPDIEIIENGKNDGYGYGHNKVLSKLDSDYHVILNPDIVFKVDTITELVKFMDDSQKAVVVTPEIRNFDDTIQHLPKKYPILKYVMSSTLPFFAKYRADYTMADKNLTAPTEIDICTGSFMMIRADIFKRINGFDEDFFMYFEDFDLSMRVKKFGEIIYNPNTFVYHAWHRDSKKSIKMFTIQIKSMLKFYQKWGFKR